MTKYAPQARYDAANTKRYALKLNIKTDADILAALDAETNKQAYIKKALRAYAGNMKEDKK